MHMHGWVGRAVGCIVTCLATLIEADSRPATDGVHDVSSPRLEDEMVLVSPRWSRSAGSWWYRLGLIGAPHKPAPACVSFSFFKGRNTGGEIRSQEASRSRNIEEGGRRWLLVRRPLHQAQGTRLPIPRARTSVQALHGAW